MQRTQYDLKDEVMSDISFTVNSYSYGFGVGVNVTDRIKVNAAFFQTLYDDYDMSQNLGSTEQPVMVTNSFTRTNRVLGLGVDFKF